MKNNNKKLYLLSFFIPFFVVLISFIVGGMAPFGEHNILSAGNHNEFIPYVFEYYDHIHSGKNLFWGNVFGLGYDFSGMLTYYFSDPTNLIILLFPRTAVISAINILYCLKISLASFSMCIFLLHKKNSFYKKYKVEQESPNSGSIKTDDAELNSDNIDKKDKMKKDFIIGFTKEPSSKILIFIQNFDWLILALSCAFALSTTMITVGSYYNYLTSISILPLIIWGINILIETNNIKKLTFFLFISMLCSIHISIISFIFINIYYFTRNFSDSKSFLRTTRRYILSIIISGMLSCIPIMNSLQGEFLKKDLTYIFPAFSIRNPFNAVNQLASFTPLSYYSVYGNGLDIAIGTGLLFLFFIYLFNNNISLKNRLTSLIVFFAYFSGTFLSTSRFLFNGLSTDAGINIHFSYIMIFFCIMCGHETLCFLPSIKSRNIIKAVIAITVLFAGGLLISDMFEKASLFLYTFEFIFFYFLILILFTNKSMTKPLTLLLFSILIFSECISCYTQNINTAANGYLSHSLLRTNTYQIYEQSRQIHNSNSTASVLNYLAETDNLLPTSYIYSGYDYIVTQNYINTDNGLYKDVTTEYINNSPFKINVIQTIPKATGIVMSSNISTYKYDEFHPFSSSNIFTNQYLDGKDTFNATYMDYSFMNSSDGEYFNTTVIPYEAGDYYIYFRNVYNLGNVKEGEERQAIFKLPSYEYQLDEYSYQAAIMDDNSFWAVLNKQYNAAPDIKDNLVRNRTATVTSQKEGYISTGFPKLTNYNYYVNNTKVTALELFDNNALLPIKEGDNTITIKYSPKNLIIEIIVTIIGILIFISMTKNSNKAEK